MKQRALGRTGLTVSEICLGTMTFGTMADEDASLRCLDQAFDAGVDFIDIAEVYPVPPDPDYGGPERGDLRQVAREQAARRDHRGHQGGRARRRLVPRAGARGPHRARPPPHRARRRGQPAPARHGLHRPLPDALARRERADRGDARGPRPAGGGRQGARRRLQQRECLWADEEPVDGRAPRHGPLRDHPEQLQPAEPSLRGPSSPRSAARNGSRSCPTARSARASCRASTWTAPGPRARASRATARRARAPRR